MIAEIVSVGTELLMGQIVNTDAQHIARNLAPLGYICYYQVTVGDNAQRLTDAVRTALSRSDLVIFTGGLGPTEDDLTKETVAEALGLTCVPIPEQVEILKRQFRNAGWSMTPNNLKQASFPESAIILKNDHGTAPGCIMEANGKAAILLPGPPHELFPMFDHYVLPYLEKKGNTHLYSRFLKVTGVGESRLTYEIRDLIASQTNPTIAPYAKPGEVELRLTAKCATDEEGEALIAPVMQAILDHFGASVYSVNGETLEEVCIKALNACSKTLSIYETGSGGLVCAALTSVPGHEQFLKEGRVVCGYDRNISSADPFSPEYAVALAHRARTQSGADLGLSVGPLKTMENPGSRMTGTAYIAISDGESDKTVVLNMMGSPERLRRICTLKAMDLLRRKCLNQPLDIDII